MMARQEWTVSEWGQQDHLGRQCRLHTLHVDGYGFVEVQEHRSPASLWNHAYEAHGGMEIRDGLIVWKATTLESAKVSAFSDAMEPFERERDEANRMIKIIRTPGGCCASGRRT
jgi:hypothetical protein